MFGRDIAVRDVSGGVTSRPRRVGDVVAEAIHRWLPQSIVEWVWWPVFLVCSFLPSSKTPVINISGLYVTLTDLLIGCLGLGMIPFTVSCRNRYRRAWRWSFLPFTALIVYALLTAVATGDYRRHDFAYQVFPAFQAWFAMVVGFTLVSSLRPKDLQGFALRLGAAVTAVAVVYIVVSFFPPRGLKSRLAIDPLFGILRLSGPLGPPTDLPGIFVVAMSFFLVGIRRLQESVFAAMVAGFLTAAVLLCGSRAGGIALIVLAVTVISRRLSLKTKIALVLASVLAAAVVFQIALPGRYLILEDTYRSRTYETGFLAWTQNLSSVVLGQGYGVIWPWYTHDVHLFLGEERWYQFYVKTRFGWTVYNPHSIYINLLAETGLLGFSLFAITLGSQMLAGFRSKVRFGLASVLHPGLLASLVIPAFSAMLLKYFALSAAWWAFFFLVAADCSMQKQAEEMAKVSRKVRPQAQPAPSMAAVRFRRESG